MAVPVQTLAALPFEMSISDVKTKPQSRDSYQPRLSADHSNRCTRTALGSIPWIVALRIAESVAAVSFDWSVDCSCVSSSLISVRQVCSGSSGSQESICRAVSGRPQLVASEVHQLTQSAVGVKLNPFVPITEGVRLCNDVVLF